LSNEEVLYRRRVKEYASHETITSQNKKEIKLIEERQ
jgi:hypothetical protein